MSILTSSACRSLLLISIAPFPFEEGNGGKLSNFGPTVLQEAQHQGGSSLKDFPVIINNVMATYPGSKHEPEVHKPGVNNRCNRPVKLSGNIQGTDSKNRGYTKQETEGQL